MTLWERLRLRVERDGPSDEDMRKAFKVRDELKAARAKRERNG